MAGGGIKINNISVSGGADGKTPIFKIENGYLYNSYDNGGNWYQLAKVKGENGIDGKDGATGAKLVSQVLQGQDANGGNIYLQTFDDGTTAVFVAPKGEKGEKGESGADYSEEINNIHKDIEELSENVDRRYTETSNRLNSQKLDIQANTDKIETVEKVLLQSEIMDVLEKSQAYTARETAEGENIVDGQTTPVLEIAGDTVKSSNLFYVNGYNEAWNELSITFDESTQEFTINGTVAKRGNILLSSSFKIANVSSAKTYTVAIIKVSGSVTFPESGSNSILLSVFDKNNANSYMPSRVTLSQSSPNVVSVSTAGIDATDLIVYMQLVNSDLGEFVFDNYKFKVQIVEGSYNTNNLPAYQPYFTGLKNAFINSIKSTGKNLFNEKYFEQLPAISADTYKGENCYRFDPTQLIDVYVPCKIKAGQRVWFSMDVAAPNGSDMYVQIVYKDGTSGNLLSMVSKREDFAHIYRNPVTAKDDVVRIRFVTYSYDKYKPYYLKNIMLSVGENRIDYEPYKESVFELPETLELGKWDKLNPQTGLIIEGTAYETSETPFTEEQIAGYKNAVVSADGLSLAYETDIPIIRPIDAPKLYTAWKNGMEMIIQGEIDNSVYGAMPTITQTYLELLGGEE